MALNLIIISVNFVSLPGKKRVKSVKLLQGHILNQINPTHFVEFDWLLVK